MGYEEGTTAGNGIRTGNIKPDEPCRRNLDAPGFWKYGCC